jgi:hypothetical protein
MAKIVATSVATGIPFFSVKDSAKIFATIFKKNSIRVAIIYSVTAIDIFYLSSMKTIIARIIVVVKKDFQNISLISFPNQIGNPQPLLVQGVAQLNF